MAVSVTSVSGFLAPTRCLQFRCEELAVWDKQILCAELSLSLLLSVWYENVGTHRRESLCWFAGADVTPQQTPQVGYLVRNVLTVLDAGSLR